jgi:hypothetical protein
LRATPRAGPGWPSAPAGGPASRTMLRWPGHRCPTTALPMFCVYHCVVRPQVLKRADAPLTPSVANQIGSAAISER